MTPTASSVPRLIPTSVRGLDEVLGGLPEHGFTLLQGGPGTGKTTLALQYILGRAAAGERCLYISLTETRRDLEVTCASHGWSMAPLELCDLTRSAASLTAESEASVFHPADTELGEVTRAVADAVERVRPAHVVFDGVSEMRLLSGDPLRYRRQLLGLKEFFAERGITALLLDDRAGQLIEIPAESLVGANIILEAQIPVYGRARRRLLVTKFRGHPFREGYHDYEIAEGGVVVYPRLRVEPADRSARHPPTSTGLPSLDAMLGGGPSMGSNIMLMGPAGVGKSTVAMQMVVAALQRGEKAAVLAFEEIEPMIIERSAKLCLGDPDGLHRYLDNGQLHLGQINPAEISPGSFADRVRSLVLSGTKVILIDSINGYLNSMPEEEFLATHLHELFAFLDQHGVLTITVVAQHGLVMGHGGGSNVDVSYLADAVMLFRYFEAGGAVRRAVTVLKKRTGAHERTLRELQIDGEGVRVGEPLREFRGIMTGVPEYRGATSLLRSEKDEAP